jgi:actin cytoskeleton-regulatory complex protein SLA1
VEAQFLGIKDGKINLHKVNGVKIAVPIAKMSHEDLDYVERATGASLTADKSGGRRHASGGESSRSGAAASAPKAGASIDPSRKEYDWFQFFLDCEVNPQLCERYSQAFLKESMDESILSDVDAAVLRTLGLREGDIIKVTRTLDTKFGRIGSKNKDKDAGDGQGGLFSGPGGTLRNNTRKGRPAPAVATSDVVDPKAFSKSDGGSATLSPATTGGAVSSAPPPKSGFDDDAWDVKPVKQTADQLTKAPTPESTAPAPQDASAQSMTGSMQELSLLSAPLQPTKAAPARAADDITVGTQSAAVASPPAQPVPGATPSFFAGVAAQARQRPQAPQTSPGQGTLQPPPPSRPLSAPQSAQPSAFSPPPLGPQMTGSVHPVLQGQVAPPGQSLGEIRVAEHYTRQLQQQQQQMQQMQQQMQQMQQMQPQPTGAFGMQQPSMGYMQPLPTGVSVMAPTAGPMQPQVTGFPSAFPQQIMGGGVNQFLPAPLEPLRTGVPVSSFASAQPMATAPAAAPIAPLVPQQTGPPPPVRFGLQPEAAKLMPQATGRRANLSQASK